MRKQNGPVQKPNTNFRLGIVFVLTSSLFFSTSRPIQSQNQSNKRYVFILDASGSMSEKWDGKTRMAVAKEKLIHVLGGLPKDASVGLVAYGNRIAGCQSARLYHPIQRGSASVVSQKLANLVPAGSTPIAQTLQVVGEYLLNDQVETEIIFISDGVESCEGDPKSVLYNLRQSGKKFRLQILGIDIDPKGEEDLKRLSILGEGNYFPLKAPDDYDKSFQKIFSHLQTKEEIKTELVHDPVPPNIPPSVSNGTNVGKIQIVSVLPYEEGSENGYILNYEYSASHPTEYMIQLYLYPAEEKHRTFPIPPLRERRMGDLVSHRVEIKRGKEGKGRFVFPLPPGKRMKSSAELWDMTGIPKIIALSEEKPIHDKSHSDRSER
ncbi:von Willebrand factor type A domain protein [Leptospira yanagawae serovar Saopaulo str. Sao Paulo = ATCC 700523]|uniref:von Willebrand factor type A domain protein n=1 Tax=Leptospira yanagawae serovar Saopaulo str. Sao Paulo = ATCC 700523 TaxID=1249483 RepID=A0A5E8HCY8_9LEPT|nr:VWA domain-containing protein [Leptospira yanagawae]EOQ89291.1 von Willebrand factor type A domain protein [Leptospira yanagawae serovar Saopaulo str. Sao Paulo = ATCC 700523]